MTTPEQLAKWREEFESSYSKDDLFFQCGEYSDRYIQFGWQGYLRRCQETEQVMKLAKFGAEVLDEAISFNVIDISDVCMFASKLDLLKDDGKVTDATETTIKELLND